MPVEYIVPSLRVVVVIYMADEDTLNERLLHLLGLEEPHFIAGFNQQVQKTREKAQHDRHIKSKAFKEGDLVLLYDSKFIKFPCKFHMNWLGPYQVKYVTDGGTVKLAKLNNEEIPTLVNGSRLKLYRDNIPTQLI